MHSSILSSDILEQQFGPTHLLILHQDHTTRIICTQATSGQQILELSLVTFTAEGITAYPSVQAAISAGQSMGKAFRAADVPFTRDIQSVQQQKLPPNFERLYQHEGPATIVLTDILVGPEHTQYAHILETYSPLVRWPDKLTPNPETIATQLASFNALLSGVNL